MQTTYGTDCLMTRPDGLSGVKDTLQMNTEYLEYPLFLNTRTFCHTADE